MQWSEGSNCKKKHLPLIHMMMVHLEPSQAQREFAQQLNAFRALPVNPFFGGQLNGLRENHHIKVIVRTIAVKRKIDSGNLIAPNYKIFRQA